MAMDRLLSMRMLTATRTICLTFIGVCSAFQIPKDPPRRFKLRAESARFWKLLDRRTTLQRVAGDFGFTEGPVWDPRGFLYVSDEEQNRIFRLYPVGRREVSSRPVIQMAARLTEITNWSRLRVSYARWLRFGRTDLTVYLPIDTTGSASIAPTI